MSAPPVAVIGVGTMVRRSHATSSGWALGSAAST